MLFNIDSYMAFYDLFERAIHLPAIDASCSFNTSKLRVMLFFFYGSEIDGFSSTFRSPPLPVFPAHNPRDRINSHIFINTAREAQFITFHKM